VTEGRRPRNNGQETALKEKQDAMWHACQPCYVKLIVTVRTPGKRANKAHMERPRHNGETGTEMRKY